MAAPAYMAEERMMAQEVVFEAQIGIEELADRTRELMVMDNLQLRSSPQDPGRA